MLVVRLVQRQQNSINERLVHPLNFSVVFSSCVESLLSFKRPRNEPRLVSHFDRDIRIKQTLGRTKQNIACRNLERIMTGNRPIAPFFF